MKIQKSVRGLTLAFLAFCVALPVASQARGELPDFTQLVERNSPLVVNISTTQKIKRTHPKLPPGMEIPEGGPWGDLFRHFFDGEGGDNGTFDSKSLGSGFTISSDGYILTNYHVVKDAEEIIVRLNDRRELAAELVGSDERSDIALLKIDAEGLPAAKLGRSEDLKVGEWVLAIGSPFGFDHSVSVGVVSAMGRSLPNESYVPFIQTDVAINPGNSGGPLFNLDGEVVGINSQIYSRTGGFMGLSFAIPIDIAMSVVEQLKDKGRVSRGWLGVLIQDVNRELAESFGMDKPIGALVARVLPDSPAEKAGLEVGDVIVEFNDSPVTYSSELPPLVGQTKVNTNANVKLIRNGKTLTKKIMIGELPAQEELAQQSSDGGSKTVSNRLAIEATDITNEQREELELDKEGGVLVQRVLDGPAKRAGIRREDILLMVNGTEVKNLNHLDELMGKLPADKSIPVLVQRRGSPIFLALKLSEDE